MTHTVELRCRCGLVRGRVANASPRSASRVVCYCDDCQAYLHKLGRSELLDAHGGSDIVQVAPSSLSFQQGTEHIVGLRLSPKGLHRWYARCCNTPVGNTHSPALPFVGILVHALDNPDAHVGKPRGGVMGKFAVGTPPEGTTKLNLRLIAGIVRRLLGWKLGGRTWPHPFYDRETKQPVYSLHTLSREEREALRPLCGPQAGGGARGLG